MIKKSHSLSELTDEQLHCRIMGHTWDDPPVTEEMIGTMRVTRQRCSCQSCGVTRSDILDEAQDVWSRSYNYERSPGYQLSFSTDVRELRAERRRRMKSRQWAPGRR